MDHGITQQPAYLHTITHTPAIQQTSHTHNIIPSPKYIEGPYTNNQKTGGPYPCRKVCDLISHSFSRFLILSRYFS